MSVSARNIGAALTALLISLLAWCWIQAAGDNKDSSLSRDNRTQPTSAPVFSKIAIDSEVAQSAGAILPTQVLVFEKVRSLSDLDQALAKQPISEGQKLAYLRHSAEFCAEIASQEARDARSIDSKPITAEAIRSRQYVKQFASDYCNRDGPTVIELQDEFLQSTPSNDEVLLAAALSELFREGDVTSAKRQAEAIMLRTSMPEALFFAAINRFAFVNGANITGWESIDRLPRPSTTRPGELAEARILAIRRLQCDLHGGCGPNGFYSVVACNIHANCRPGITAEQAWQGAYSPALLAYSNAVYQELIRLRLEAANGIGDP